MADRKRKMCLMVLCNGKLSDVKTWSGVPFYLSQALQSHGAEIVPVDISRNKWLFLCWVACFGVWHRLLFPCSSYRYVRSSLHAWDVKRRTRQALNARSDVSGLIFFTFSFSSAGLTSLPCVQICDWTYQHQICQRLNRKQPGWLERRAIERERLAIGRSQFVWSTYPVIASQLKEMFPFLDVSVVRAVNLQDADIAFQLGKKKKRFVFVGKSRYAAELACFFPVFQTVRREFPGLEFHVVGMTDEMFPDIDHGGVVFHGVLDKSRKEDYKAYVTLVSEATAFVNVCPTWGPVGAMLEALWLYTPVVLLRLPEYESVFGKEAPSLIYVDQFDQEEIVKTLRELLSEPDMEQRCVHAHELVKSFSWDAVAEAMIRQVGGYESA